MGLMGQRDTVQGRMEQCDNAGRGWDSGTQCRGRMGQCDSAGGGWDSDTDRNGVRALTNVLSTSDSEISGE